jgi:hypothetical protein
LFLITPKKKSRKLGGKRWDRFWNHLFQEYKREGVLIITIPVGALKNSNIIDKRTVVDERVRLLLRFSLTRP